MSSRHSQNARGRTQGNAGGTIADEEETGSGDNEVSDKYENNGHPEEKRRSGEATRQS